MIDYHKHLNILSKNSRQNGSLVWLKLPVYFEISDASHSLAGIACFLICFHSYLCFEKAKTSFGKHIVIQLESITSLTKVKLLEF